MADLILITTADRKARAAALVRELGSIARDLMRLDAMADRAATREDIDSLFDVAEDMLIQHVQFAERYRMLLVVHIRERRTDGHEGNSW